MNNTTPSRETIRMNFYNKYILPRYLNFAMARKDIEEQRLNTVSEAAGVVLEIGFGSGLNLPYYQNITKLYALDPSQELFDLAQERIAKISFPFEHLKASAEKIPLPDHSVDSLVSTWTLCSIPSPESALREMFRVLKPGGKYSFVEHGLSPRPLVAKWQRFLTPLTKCIGGGCHLDRAIETLIKEAGFEILKLEKYREKSRPLGFAYKGIAAARKRTTRDVSPRL